MGDPLLRAPCSDYSKAAMFRLFRALAWTVPYDVVRPTPPFAR